MKGILQVKEFIATIWGKITNIYRNNSSVLDESLHMNIKRIYYLSLIVIPSRILHIILFMNTSSQWDLWGKGIIISHSILLFLWVGVFFVVRRLRDRTQSGFSIRFIQYTIPVLTMISGIAIVVIDQLVTSNITPFLLVSIVVGAVFLIRPLISAIIYLISYTAYYHLIGMTTSSEQILLSNRINGTTAVSIGFLISAMVWHYNYLNITQNRRIKMQKEQLRKMAYYDQLTNLYNRHFFNQMIEKEFSSVQRYGNKSAIIILDIDNFKNINDNYGHLVGDQVLVELAQLIMDNLRQSDVVARFGGEEFIILAPNTDLENGVSLAEKLRRLIAGKTFSIGANSLNITASFGVSLLRATEGEALKHYYSLADNALYLAKKRGKNRVEKW